MTILILITFLQRERILLFPCSLVRTIDEINKSAHGFSLLVVSNYAFQDLSFWSFNQREALQRVNIVVRLPREAVYSVYRCFNIFKISALSKLDF